MDENRSKALDAALAQIEKQFGKGSIMRLGANDVALNPSGQHPVLDPKAIGDGLVETDL